MSFEDFCGFVGDHNGQWQPNLLRNTLTIHRWLMTRLDSFFSSGSADIRILCNNRHSRAIALAHIAQQEPWPRNQSAASRIRSEPRKGTPISFKAGIGAGRSSGLQIPFHEFLRSRAERAELVSSRPRG